ncbi:CLUMA_CG020024, isoform A [Clunio marinus]|uniref:CLUMA_CG020024, isoform A n=1 Tax=Clunio marinus TaxID=568069 RepID=A0A1J1J7Z9_9DIPT|nr:CLUMA_CG020024, isoform A [Clunio marinus]
MLCSQSNEREKQSAESCCGSCLSYASTIQLLTNSRSGNNSKARALLQQSNDENCGAMITEAMCDGPYINNKQLK